MNRFLSLPIALSVVVASAGAARADRPDPKPPHHSVTTAPAGDAYEVAAEDNHHAHSHKHPGVVEVATQASQYSSYAWSTTCMAGSPVACGTTLCNSQAEILWRLFGLAANGNWVLLDTRCAGSTAPAPVGAPPAPVVTPAMVLQAFKRVPVPSYRAHTQPAGKTLVNFDTIFYTDAQPLTRNVVLLGQNVRLEIKPSTFTWVHGDGTTATTSTPGAAYPAKDIVYRYAHAHRTVQEHVEIVWTAQYSLNGGPLQDVAGTVTTIGPATPLRIAEATPALSGAGH
jgi:hypothetical protein